MTSNNDKTFGFRFEAYYVSDKLNYKISTFH